MEVDFYFFADERERYWNRKIPLVEAGDFRRVELRRYRVAGQAVMPGIALELSRAPLRRGRQVAQRQADAARSSTSPAARAACRSCSGRACGTTRRPRSTASRDRSPSTSTARAEAIVAYGEHVKRFVVETAGVDPGKVYVAGQAVEPERFASVQPSRNGPAEVLFVGQFEERKGLDDLLDAFAALPDLPATAPARRQRLAGGRGVAPGGAATRAWSSSDTCRRSACPQSSRAPAAWCCPSITTALDREPWGLVVNEAMHAGRSRRRHRRGRGGRRRARAGRAQRLRRAGARPVGARGRDPPPRRRARSWPRGSATRRARTCERFSHSAMADAFEAAVEHADRGGRRWDTACEHARARGSVATDRWPPRIVRRGT